MTIWELSGGRSLEIDRLPLVMGILNVTPDSFSDGGSYDSVEAAVSRALRMVEEGADLVDVGGESTRPGADPVTAEEELERVVPVIRGIRQHSAIPLSIDTMKSSVAAAALEAGADIINDVTGLRGDEKMARLAGESGSPVILMHMRGTPRTMQDDPAFDDVVSEILEELEPCITKAISAGVSEERIWIDPGIGFGKTPAHNVEILGRIEELAARAPVLIGASRKSFIGALTGGTKGDQRLGGSLAAVDRAAEAGAVAVRVHDVLETIQFLTVRREIGKVARAAG